MQVWIWRGGTLKRHLSKQEDFEQLETCCTRDVTNVSIYYIQGLIDPQEVERLRGCIQDALRNAGNDACEVKVCQLWSG